MNLCKAKRIERPTGGTYTGLRDDCMVDRSSHKSQENSSIVNRGKNQMFFIEQSQLIGKFLRTLRVLIWEVGKSGYRSRAIVQRHYTGILPAELLTELG